MKWNTVTGCDFGRAIKSDRKERRMPLDFCRCHDHACPKRESCLRYKDKRNVPTPNAATLRGDDGKCHYYIDQSKT